MPLSHSVRKFFNLLKFDNCIQVVLNRVCFPGTALTVYRYKGVTALVDHSRGDQDGVKACLVPGLYDPFLKVIAPDCPSPVAIVDLGANTGGFPLALLAHGFHIRKGVSVELNPVTCTRLAVNLAENGLDRCVMIINGAACGTAGNLEVRLSGGSVSDSIVFGCGAGEPVSVRAWTLDGLITAHFEENDPIDICKIDIEGAEYALFDEPFHETLTRCRWVIIEIHAHPGRDAAEVVSRIIRLGFTNIKPAAVTVEDNVYLFRRNSPVPELGGSGFPCPSPA